MWGEQQIPKTRCDECFPNVEVLLCDMWVRADDGVDVNTLQQLFDVREQFDPHHVDVLVRPMQEHDDNVNFLLNTKGRIVLCIYACTQRKGKSSMTPKVHLYDTQGNACMIE